MSQLPPNTQYEAIPYDPPFHYEANTTTSEVSLMVSRFVILRTLGHLLGL